jgi:hypothetical protein
MFGFDSSFDASSVPVRFATTFFAGVATILRLLWAGWFAKPWEWRAALWTFFVRQHQCQQQHGKPSGQTGEDNDFEHLEQKCQQGIRHLTTNGS